MKLNRIALAGAVVLSAAAPAAAQTRAATDAFPRWYGALDIGYHAPATIEGVSVGLAPDGLPYDWNFRLYDSWAAFGRYGYRVRRDLRLEVETGFFNSGLREVQAPGGVAEGVSIARPGEPYGLCYFGSTPTGCAPVSRSPNDWAWAWTLMGNAIYDFAPERRIDPFVGVGLGVAHVEWLNNNQFGDVTGPISASNPPVQSLKLGGSVNRPSQFAYQFIGGLSWRVSPSFRIDLTYRNVRTAGRLRWNTLNDTPGVSPSEGLQPGDFRGVFRDQSISIGLRYLHRRVFR